MRSIYCVNIRKPTKAYDCQYSNTINTVPQNKALGYVTSSSDSFPQQRCTMLLMFSNTHYAVFPLWTKPICWEQFHCANIGCSSPRGQVIVSGKKASFHKHTTVYMLNTATCFLWNQILPKNTSILAIQDNLSINELHCVWMIICLYVPVVDWWPVQLYHTPHPMTAGICSRACLPQCWLGKG